MQQIECVYKKKYTYLILFLLLVPSKNNIIIILISSILIFLFPGSTKLNKNIYFNFGIFMILYILFSSFIRFFITLSSNYRDFQESMRFLPVILIFARIEEYKNIKIENFADAMFVYLIFDGVVSYLQHIKSNIFGINQLILKFYNSDYQHSISVQLNNRAIGLSPGPAQHGALLALIFIIMLNIFILYDNRKILSVIGSFLSFLIILSSQSRTSFVAIIVVSVILFGYYIFKGLRIQKFKIIIIFSIAIILGLYVIQNYVYLLSIFNPMTRDRAIDIRLSMSNNFINDAFKKPFWLIFGYGKDFFGKSSASMDNEYTYIFLVYGIFISLLLIRILIKFLIFTIKLGKQNFTKYYINLILFFITLTGLIIAFPAAFFIDIKILIMICLVICLRHNMFEKNYNTHSTFSKI